MNFSPFLTYLISEKRSSAHTVEAYRSDLEQFDAFISSAFDVHSAAEVNTAMVRTWLASLMEAQYAVTSVHRKLSAVRAFFRFMQRTGATAANPVKGITKPKKPKRLPVFVDEKATTALYNMQEGAAWEDVRNRLMVKLFYETGIRLSELMGIHDGDIDHFRGQIKVLGKRNKMRMVPVSTDMLHQLNHYKTLREAEFGKINDGHFFVGKDGKKITKNVVYQTVKAYLSTVTTLQKKSPHVLRHTFATHMLNNGADLNVIKEILGHSSLAATQVYTHNSIEKLRSIHATMHPRENKV